MARCGEDLLPLAVVPFHHARPVKDAVSWVIDQQPFPFSLQFVRNAVINERDGVLVVARANPGGRSAAH